jgi:steroid delta-isomerase-like uncharacterized protein
MPTVADVTEVEALAARYGEAWNSQDLEAIVEFHAPDGLFHLHAGGEAVEGKEAIRANFAAVIAQWPDIHFEERQLIADERGWVLQSTMSGTLAQPLELDGSVIAQPGAKISVDALDLIGVKEGLITAKHTYLDSATLLRQLGVVA